MSTPCFYASKSLFQRLGAVLFAVLCLSLTSIGQTELASALKQKYRLAEINMQGVVANPGTVFTIEADGINAEPYPTMITFENPVVDGQVKQRSKGFGLLKSNNLQILQPGQKVYITKINEHSANDGDALKVTILTTDAVLATYGTGYGQYQTGKRYSTTLAFKLPKGALTQMSAEDASKVIEAVLSVNAADQIRRRDSGTVARSCEPHCAVSTTTGSVVGGAVVAPEGGSSGQAATQTVAIGQTINQVTATLGAPAQIVDLGAKKIYRYADMKVIFMNGVVADVQ